MKPMSLSVSPETEEMFDKEAQKRGMARSELFRYILEKFPINKDDVHLIVLQIPKSKMQDKNALISWLKSAFATLLKKL